MSTTTTTSTSTTTTTTITPPPVAPVSDYLLINPDWDRGINLRKRWKTAIQTSLKNNEKRSSLYTWPRRIYRFTLIALNYNESITLKQKIYKNLSNIWGIPYWQDETALSAQADSGQATLEIEDTTNRNFEEGAECLLGSKDSYEIGIIQSLTDTQIILVDLLGSTWPIGTKIYPILKGRIKKAQNIGYYTGTVSGLQIEVEEEYDEITRYDPTISGFSTYRGIPIFDLKFNWAQLVGASLSHDLKIMEFIGKSFSYTHWDETKFSFRGSYLSETKSKIWQLIQFFDVCMGRWGAFWKSSGVSDIIVSDPFEALDNQIVVRSSDYPEYWEGTNAGLHIILIWPDDTFVCCGVISASGNTITVHNSIGKACSLDELSGLTVSFLSLCRFSQDEIDIKYLTDSVATSNLKCDTILLETPSATTTTTTTTSSSTTSSSTTTV